MTFLFELFDLTGCRLQNVARVRSRPVVGREQNERVAFEPVGLERMGDSLNTMIDLHDEIAIDS